jgi:hypothetical protein
LSSHLHTFSFVVGKNARSAHATKRDVTEENQTGMPGRARREETNNDDDLM